MLAPEFGFREKRIKRALKSILNQVESLTCGYIGLTDYKRYLDENTNFKWDKLLEED